MMKLVTSGLLALSLAWAGSAGAAPSSAAGNGAAADGAAASDDPIELDGVAFQGATQGQRVIADTGHEDAAARAEHGAGRKRLEALVLFSAADGVGFGGQLRSGGLGLRGALTYQPLLFLVDADPADKKFGSFEFANTVQLNVDAMLVGVDSETGGSIGYRYNDLLGHGVTVAYQSVFDAWGEHFSLSFPVTYYPAATSRVRDRLDIASGYEINFPFGAGLQFGMGAAWVL